MISFRTQNDKIASTIAILAMLVLAGTLAVMLIVPKPKAAASQRVFDKNKLDIQIDTKKAEEAAAASKAAIDPLLWTGSPAEIAPRALSTVTALSATHKLKLVAFRPQRSNDADTVTVLPFSIALEGSFPDVAQMVTDLETPDTKLAVNQIQIASADGDTDKITATIGVVAYMPLKKAPTPAPTPTTTAAPAKS